MSSFAQLTSLHSTQKCMHTKQILHLCMPKWSYFNADSSNYTYKAKRNYQSSIDSIVFISIVKSKIIKLCQDCHVLHFPSPLACSLFVSTATSQPTVTLHNNTILMCLLGPVHAKLDLSKHIAHILKRRSVLLLCDKGCFCLFVCFDLFPLLC